MRISILAAVLAAAISVPATAFADKPLAILMPGGSGGAPSDFLVRNRSKFRSAGIDTVVVTDPGAAIAAARAEPAERTVVIVGMSKGALQTSIALKNGVAADAAVFVSGDGRKALGNLKGRTIDIPMLWVHHVADACEMSPFTGAQAFASGVRGDIRLVAFDFKGAAQGPVCAPRHAHGFYQKDTQPIKAITDFIKGL